MPGRKIPLVTNYIYHVINRGVAFQPVFLNQKHYQRAMETIFYYQNYKPRVRYSYFLRLPTKPKVVLLEELREQRKILVEIIALSLIPNHFHFLLKQVRDKGISTFMSNFSNSYTRYFNTKEKRVGPLFQGKFKAVRIKTDEQLLHVSRYIHLQPYSSHIVKTFKDLIKYPYSSFPEYLGLEKTNYYSKAIVLNQFKGVSNYKKFVLDQADYQRRLQEIKKLTLEE